MEVPAGFARELNEAFGGRFRLRWSNKREEFHVEQRVSNGRVLEPPTDDNGDWDTYDDDYIRARDGFKYVMAVRDGDRMPCPICNATLSVPIMETREVVCVRCRLSGRDGRVAAAYYPLNHVLIEHLRYIDPLTDGVNRVRERIIAANARVHPLAKRKREFDEADAKVMDNKLQAFNIPFSGYGPKGRKFEY